MVYVTPDILITDLPVTSANPFMYMSNVQQIFQNTLNGDIVAALDFPHCLLLTCYLLIPHDNFVWGMYAQ